MKLVLPQVLPHRTVEHVRMVTFTPTQRGHQLGPSPPNPEATPGRIVSALALESRLVVIREVLATCAHRAVCFSVSRALSIELDCLCTYLPLYLLDLPDW